MSHVLLETAPGPHLLLGNEAIVRGALEAGVNVVACYPGTPSSEVPDSFRMIRDSGRFYLEYSTNEKVAMEVAGGAALGGAMALVTMKHVGLNVAADPLFTMCYVGLPGGLVILSADDPGCHSSQDEQDNRYYARFAGLPCFEPATAQECKDMTRDAFLLARETQQPVLLRTTTRINHLRGPVKYGPLPSTSAPLVAFTRNPQRFVPVPAVSRRRHHELVKNLEAIRGKAESSPWNTETGTGKLGIITSGVARSYLKDVLLGEGWQGDVKVLELGFSYPLPLERIEAFMGGVEKLLVLEEGEPLLEREIRALAQQRGVSLPISGKGGPLTVFDEYSVPLVRDALSALLGKSPKPAPRCEAGVGDLPQRPPSLCAGCAHRAVYYAVRKVFGNDAVYSSDIGCYTLGMAPPLATADFLFCMGSSISAGSGFARASGKTVLSFIGDSTFFHSGMTGLVNAVFNKHDVLIVILDNGTTAMTGHQPNPGVDQALLGDSCVHLDIESVVRGCGVTEVHRVKPYNVKSTVATLEDLKGKKGVRVIIAEEPCVLFARRTLKKSRPAKAHVAEQGAETSKAAKELACPAFVQQGDTVSVDESACAGCMVCLQLAPGFKARKKERA